MRTEIDEGSVKLIPAYNLLERLNSKYSRNRVGSL